MKNLNDDMAHGTGPTEDWPKKKIWDIIFCPIRPKKIFGPIPRQVAEIIGGLLATELQSHRHPRDTVYGWVKFFCA